MTIEEIIKKAVEGGWNFQGIAKQLPEYNPDAEGFLTWENENGMDIELWHISKFFLDPQFWQALGKAMGWGFHLPNCKFELSNCSYKKTHKYCPHPEHLCDCNNDYSAFQQWHKFIDHLAAGKTAEDYFSSLKN